MQRRVLTIDGGGIKGVVPAAYLAEIERHLPLPIHRYFDLIVGTSTGGLIAAGLAMGRTASQIVQMYKQSGSRIFPSRGMLGSLRHLFAPKHDVAVLRKELEREFGRATLGEALTRLVIPAWDRDGQSVHLWKTRHHERFRRDHSLPIVEALVSTACAPTYFASLSKDGGTEQIDGGVWANNPMLVAAIEAVGVLGWDRHAVSMLSLGCIDDGRPAPSAGGLWAWRTQAVELFLAAQGKAAVGGAFLLLDDRHNQPERILRVVASAPPGRFELDGAKATPQLEALGRELAERTSVRVVERFFGVPTEPFVPERETSAVDRPLEEPGGE